MGNKNITFILTVSLMVWGLFTNMFITTPNFKPVGKPFIKEYVSYKQQLYIVTLDSVINFRKHYEGFRANWYDDNGYPAIGYGQRKRFSPREVIAPITEQEAESLLRESFDAHLKLVNRLYPRLNKYQKLSVAHMSYCIGIGKVRKWKLIVNNQLDTAKLMSLPYKSNRQFEMDLFYKYPKMMENALYLSYDMTYKDTSNVGIDEMEELSNPKFTTNGGSTRIPIKTNGVKSERNLELQTC